jgi:hypothetical protein
MELLKRCDSYVKDEPLQNDGYITFCLFEMITSPYLPNRSVFNGQLFRRNVWRTHCGYL